MPSLKQGIYIAPLRAEETLQQREQESVRGGDRDGVLQNTAPGHDATGTLELSGAVIAYTCPTKTGAVWILSGAGRSSGGPTGH